MAHRNRLADLSSATRNRVDRDNLKLVLRNARFGTVALTRLAAVWFAVFFCQAATAKMSNSLFRKRISSLTRCLHVRQCPLRIIRITSKSLHRSGRCPHRLKASGGTNDALNGTMVGFGDVVQVLQVRCFMSAGSLPSRCSRRIAFG
jgi:hypothetical protein